MSLYSYDDADLEGLTLVESYRKMKIYEDVDKSFVVVYRKKEIDCQIGTIESAKFIIDHYFQE